MRGDISAEICFMRTTARHSLGPQQKWTNYERITHSTINSILEKYRRNLKNYVGKTRADTTPPKFKVPIKREKKFRNAFETMEGSCYIMPIRLRGLSMESITTTTATTTHNSLLLLWLTITTIIIIHRSRHNYISVPPLSTTTASWGINPNYSLSKWTYHHVGSWSMLSHKPY